MAEKYPYHGLDGKIKCKICSKDCVLQMKDDGTVLFTCGESERQRPVPIICWEDIAAKVCEAAQITDLYLDFLYEIIEEVVICQGDISVKIQRVSGRAKSELLHLQDHWLVYHSLQGDVSAKEQIVLQIGPLVKYHLRVLNRRVSLPRAELEDVEQIVWLSVFSYLKTYNSQYRLWTWIKCIATRVFYKQLFKGRKTYSSEEMVRIRSDKRQMERPSNIDDWASREYVRSLLRCLTAQESWVIVEHVLKQKSQNKLAGEGDIKLRDLRRIYKNALEKLRILILEEEK